ncbi:hypothetical protein Sme01_37240 [Sphaerisporangium melleum]|uniref:Probable endolytic peptidoglycan transglycosylase RlpA n=1 Tax=Sphaerisporangium melleum TaxID=321316 RepID=A0A917RBS4_9ACTN|nr:septal ring lytic transglycosylase RlpA family protein [Sphaerisporangium melleum]GGL00145.1 hypothetical protein GCM10007964_47840 [Sphaerisporangium melleum]GII71248.1 hypothetical protein Sme01_37240 [Sphaerisporangium melleum]
MGLHASPTRWYEKSLSRARQGARERRRPASLAHAVTSTVAVTVVVTAAVTGAWIAIGAPGPSSLLTSADLIPVGHSPSAPPASPSDMTSLAAARHGSPVPASTPAPYNAWIGSLSLATAGVSTTLSPFARTASGTESAGSESAGTPASASATDSGRTAKASAPSGSGTTGKQASASGGSGKKRAVKRAKVIASGRCGASYYDEGQVTANGERFNPNAMTAAHKTLPMGSRVRVTNPRNGKTVTVRINDRGPYVSGRCLDLSRAAFDAIGSLSTGAMPVKYAVLAR